MDAQRKGGYDNRQHDQVPTAEKPGGHAQRDGERYFDGAISAV